MTSSDAQLVAKARKILNKMGIARVCLDTLKSDRSGTDEERIDRLVSDSFYWDGYRLSPSDKDENLYHREDRLSRKWKNGPLNFGRRQIQA